MSTTRRTFLATGLSAGATVPFLGRQPAWLRAAGNGSDDILVVVQIRGGWDQLQVVAEVDHPVYRAARPLIALQKAKVLPIAANLNHYWHPAALPFKALFDRGDLAVIQNIGYPQPNLSHFASEKKWYSADPTASVVDEGWLATYLAKGYTGGFSIPAINLESRLNPVFQGTRVPVFTRDTDFQFTLDNNLYARADNAEQLATVDANGKVLRPGADPNLLYLANSTVDAVADSTLLQNVGSTYTPKVTYPNTALSRTLQIAARYITGGLRTQVYYTSRGGFDTHANEVVNGATETGTLANNVGDVAGSVKAFLDDIKAYGKGPKVVVMIFSEFGRRLGENGSLGTDHGHGGLAFLAGEPVIGGMFGKAPDLSKATTPYNNYYIPFDANSTDFRSLYATVIEKWFGVAHGPILGGAFPLLGAL